jgi:hypothetical protein
MTETPSDPSGPGESSSEYGSAPPPPPAPAGYQAPAPPPPGAGTPAAQPPVAEPAGQYQAPPTGYQAGYQAPPIGHEEQPPATPGGFQAAAAGFGQQFANYDPATIRNFNPREASPLDLGIIAAGVLAFIFSLLHFYKYTVSIVGIGSRSESISAWGHGFFGWFGALVALLAALLLAAVLVAQIRFPFPTQLVVLGGFALALLCELLALFVIPGDTGGVNGAFGIKIDKGHSYGYWLTLIMVVVGTALAYKRFADSGGKLPGRR